jgi:hypothetical protein
VEELPQYKGAIKQREKAHAAKKYVVDIINAQNADPFGRYKNNVPPSSAQPISPPCIP